MTPDQMVAYHTRSGVKPWPPRVENREQTYSYPFFSAYEYVCSCGVLIRQTNSTRVRPEPDFYGVKLQHGDNREAVLVLDAFGMILPPELEEHFAKWTDDVHAYQKRGGS